MQEEYEEEMKRVISLLYEEEMKRVKECESDGRKSVFNRERNKYKRSNESWKENGPGAYHQHFQRDDWYWKANASYRDQRTNYRQSPRDSASYPLSHHYSVLGLDRTEPYTEDEIKTAFRTKAKQFHPNQDQDNKEVAEAKFKEVITSYEAKKQERKNMKA